MDQAVQDRITHHVEALKVSNVKAKEDKRKTRRQLERPMTKKAYYGLAHEEYKG